MWFRKSRKRSKAAWDRFSAVADRIGARGGHLLKENYMGGIVVPDGLAIVTIRPGSVTEVAQAQIDAAVAAGYSRPPEPPCDSKSPCGFAAHGDLPMLTIETFPAGSFFRGTANRVPAGHTGVIVAMG